MGTHLNLYLKCNAGAPHSSQKWLKPFSVLFLCLLCNGLYNTLVTVKQNKTKKTDNDTRYHYKASLHGTF